MLLRIAVYLCFENLNKLKKMINRFKIELLPNGKYIIKKRYLLFFYRDLCELIVPSHIINAPTIVAASECYYTILDFNTKQEAEEYIKEVYGK